MNRCVALALTKAWPMSSSAALGNEERCLGHREPARVILSSECEASVIAVALSVDDQADGIGIELMSRRAATRTRPAPSAAELF